jgi:hypothetical protein
VSEVQTSFDSFEMWTIRERFDAYKHSEKVPIPVRFARLLMNESYDGHYGVVYVNRAAALKAFEPFVVAEIAERLTS